jgi:hypothetical protein
MTFRANRPFRLRLNGQARTIAQGQTFELDPDAGERLLAKAPGLVSTVLINVNVGELVHWCSPLFGNRQGVVLLIEGENVLVSHPIIGQPAWICRAWLLAREIYDRHS